MKKQARNILVVAGVISMVMGIMGAVPSFLQENYLGAALAAVFVICGLVLLAVALGD